MKETNAKFVVCDPETEEEAKKALNKAENLLAIGRVEGCDDLIALAEIALEGINDKFNCWKINILFTWETFYKNIAY